VLLAALLDRGAVEVESTFDTGGRVDAITGEVLCAGRCVSCVTLGKIGKREGSGMVWLTLKPALIMSAGCASSSSTGAAVGAAKTLKARAPTTRRGRAKCMMISEWGRKLWLLLVELRDGDDDEWQVGDTTEKI
jgi:hypothetical protein